MFKRKYIIPPLIKEKLEAAKKRKDFEARCEKAELLYRNGMTLHQVTGCTGVPVGTLVKLWQGHFNEERRLFAKVDNEFEWLMTKSIRQQEEISDPLDLLLKKELRNNVELCLDTLRENDDIVITLRTLGYTLEAVANFLGVTRERIRQREAKAIRVLRHPSRKALLKGEDFTAWYDKQKELENVKCKEACSI